jgi:hypothetical protein
MDQTDVAFGVALPASACTAALLIKWAEWPWYFGLPIGLVGGFLLTVVAVFLLIEVLARLFGRSKKNPSSDSDS